MALRPAPTYWFETYVPRTESVYALELLATSGKVQLELDPRLSHPLDLETVNRFVDRFQLLRERYEHQLPAAKCSSDAQVEAPEISARKALEYLEAWSATLDDPLQQQARLEAEQRKLLLIHECLSSMRITSQDSSHLRQRSGFLYKALFACPTKTRLPPDVCASIDEFVAGREHNFFIVADQPGCRDVIEKAYSSKDCVSIQVPDWISWAGEEPQYLVETRLNQIAGKLNEVRVVLDEKSRNTELSAHIANINRLIWYIDQARHLGTARSLCHITGWTTVDDVEVLQNRFRLGGIHGTIRFTDPPRFCHTPVDMQSPAWTKPFRFILEMLGTPDRNEVDASRLLPVIVPLLFGYMFPDIGHGLMLVLFSAALYRRWPAGRFLIPCGISAMLFGLVFGEVFGLDDVIEPLWFHPLDHPLEILLVPLLFGVGMILLGLAFNGIEALWRGRGRSWVFRDAAVLVMYCAIVSGLFVPESLWIAAFAVIWFLLGQSLSTPNSHFATFWRSLGMLLHSVFNLSLNSLSFVRVGAFALAHAGLSASVLALIAGVSSDILYILLLGIGNILTVTLEGLVVFVQTTRLVLFEFALHFLRAEGRIFQPMSKPGQ